MVKSNAVLEQVMTVQQAWDGLFACANTVLAELKRAAEFWKVIAEHGTEEDRAKLAELRTGFFELTALIAEGKLSPEFLEACPRFNILRYVGGCLSLDAQNELLEAGNVTLYQRGPTNRIETRAVLLKHVKVDDLRAAVDYRTGTLKTKEEQLAPVEQPSSETESGSPGKGCSDPLWPEGKVQKVFVGGKNSKVAKGKIGTQLYPPSYFLAVAEQLIERTESKGAPTFKVDLRLTREELAAAEKAMGDARTVGEYLRSRLLAYGVI